VGSNIKLNPIIVPSRGDIGVGEITVVLDDLLVKKPKVAPLSLVNYMPFT